MNGNEADRRGEGDYLSHKPSSEEGKKGRLQGELAQDVDALMRERRCLTAWLLCLAADGC